MTAAGDGLADLFIGIHDSNKWGSAESRSGPGSGLHVTAPVRRALPTICRGLGISTFLDAPCGDMNWMRHTVLPVDEYIGVDVVPAVIEANAEAYGGPGRRFLTADLTRGPLPTADLVMSRDFLVHLTEEDAFKALRQFRRSARYLLATTFYAQEKNLKGSNGGWRPLNLQRPPFDFPPPLLIVPERQLGVGSYSDKALGLWNLADLDLPAEPVTEPDGAPAGQPPAR